VAIANPEGVRWQAYARALRDVWGDTVEVVVVPWRDVIAQGGCLDTFTAFDTPAIVRMESPGRDWGVAQQLLYTGDGNPAWLNYPYQKGRLVAPATFYVGFVRVLEGLERSFADRPHLHVTAQPRAIAHMFDKNASGRRMEAADVPIPETWTKPLTVAADLLAKCPWPTTYVKLNTGSSASAMGVVRQEPSLAMISSVIRLGDGFFSTRRLCRLTGEPLHQVLQFLLDQGVCVQRGIRMAQIDGCNFDVRMVVIYGQPAFAIFRLSHLPMTNLHLGGKRGDPTRCRAAIPPRLWLDGRDAALRAASCFDSAICGVDLLFEAGYQRCYVLEVNAFGDFFPNLVNEAGQGPHHVEIVQTARRLGFVPPEEAKN
jgi:hypothetical protein